MIKYLRSFPDLSTRRLEEGQRFIFHHLPKTAGSTFRTILDGYFEPGEICPEEVERTIFSMDEARLRTFRLFAGHYSYPFVMDQFPDAVRLVFLRHPVARVISQYYNLHDTHRIPAQWREHSKHLRPEHKAFQEWVAGCSLEAFVQSDDPYAINNYQNYQTIYLTRRSQAHIFDEPIVHPRHAPDILAEAKENLVREFAFVGVQEDFRASMQVFAATFGLRPLGKTESMFRNFNPRKAGFSKYDVEPHILERIAACNPMDLELWEFARTLLHQRMAMLLEESGRKFLARQPGLTADAREPRFIPLSECSQRRGFYWMERDELGREFAWSGYEQPAILEFEMELEPGEEVEVRVHALSAYAGECLDGLAVEFDGRRMAHSLERVGDGIRITGRATVRTFPRWVHAVKMKTGVGREITDTGERYLGLAVHGFSILRLDRPADERDDNLNKA
jgi:hypothetical protein